MCSDDGAYASTRGDGWDNNCVKCGCQCNPDYYAAGNADGAAFTFRHSA